MIIGGGGLITGAAVAGLLGSVTSVEAVVVTEAASGTE